MNLLVGSNIGSIELIGGCRSFQVFTVDERDQAFHTQAKQFFVFLSGDFLAAALAVQVTISDSMPR